MERRGLASRLEYLLAEVAKVAESGAEVAGFAKALALHLERALCEATVLTAELDALRTESAARPTEVMR